MIIRGERIIERATLTSSREIEYASSYDLTPSWFEQERLEAFEKGKEEGEEKGYLKAIAEMESCLKLLQTLSVKLLEHKHQLIDQLKPEVIQFAINLCERMIRRELSHPENFIRWIHYLFSYLANQTDQETIHLILAPEDLVILQTQLSQVLTDHSALKAITLRSDPLMRRGDCRIETPTKMLNWSIHRELEDLQAKIISS
jgi:flagellar assembly protein FliH